jgi:AraC-like DNA-binding protein
MTGSSNLLNDPSAARSEMKTKSSANQSNVEAVEPVEGLFELPRKLVVLAKHYPNGYSISFHSHYSAQLEYASLGVMKVMTRKGIWCVPPQRAVFIPAHMEHQSSSSGGISLCNLLIQPDAAPGLPEDCCVVTVPPLLRELMLHAVTLPRLYEDGSAEERIVDVILDMLQGLESAPLDLPIGSDARIRRVYEGLSENPDDNRSLESWGHMVGASGRTLARLFRSQTGLSFRQWRQQLRILEAIDRLGRGDSVTTIALDLGYESPSAFITMFKKALGKTPGQYFRA